MTHLVIVGGSDAGISAALRAREVDRTVEVTVVVADRFPNYSICGLPFYLSGEVADWHTLAHRTREEIAASGVNLLLEHTAQRIDPATQTVQMIDQQGQTHTMSYDRLIVATGAVPVRPAIEGLDLPGVYLLHSMADSFAIQHHLLTRPPRSALIVGGGYIGLEMADALTVRGIAVTVVEHGPSVLKTVDAPFGTLVEQELRQHGVTIVAGVAVEQISAERDYLRVQGSSSFQATADLVLVAVGVRPDTSVALSADLALGVQGAIQVDCQMATSIPNVFAAGDCTATYHRLLGRPTYLPLGTTAHKQGRIAGENALGGTRRFAGSLGTQVVKVCNLVIARTGLRDQEAREAGFDPLTIEDVSWDHKVYYPGAQRMRIRLTGDRSSGRLLGAQILGSWHSEIAKRIDIFAAALFHEMAVEELNQLDLSYTPPVSSPWDPVQLSAQVWAQQQQQAHP